MNDLSLRRFHVSYETVTNLGDSLTIEHKVVDAAYYQQGLGNVGNGADGDSFIVFKDDDYKPVFTVRASSVVTIEEIRGQQAGAETPGIQTFTIEDATPPMSDAEIQEFCDNMARRFRKQRGDDPKSSDRE